MAIDDNTSYELTGYQVKDLAGRIRRKADASSVPTSISDLGQVTSSDVDWSTMPGSYSTTEQKTPFTWIDGKPIYKKTFSFTLANAESTTVNHGISNFGLLIKFEGTVVQSSAKNVPIPRTLIDFNYQVGLEGVTATSFEVDVGANGPRGKQAYVTLWYTKSS